MARYRAELMNPDWDRVGLDKARVGATPSVASKNMRRIHDRPFSGSPR